MSEQHVQSSSVDLRDVVALKASVCQALDEIIFTLTADGKANAQGPGWWLHVSCKPDPEMPDERSVFDLTLNVFLYEFTNDFLNGAFFVPLHCDGCGDKFELKLSEEDGYLHASITLLNGDSYSMGLTMDYGKWFEVPQETR